ncbi:hypothetical protein ACJIZ3_005145 [Penstemon smallii]|uniref:Uncharacterized protein n=1 Tax=Penstemon smallii TaxID=265156 RepID=A0ABD3S420_9LAMI
MVKTLHSKSTPLPLRSSRQSKGKDLISTPLESLCPSQAQTNDEGTTSSDTTRQTISDDTSKLTIS